MKMYPNLDKKGQIRTVDFCGDGKNIIKISYVIPHEFEMSPHIKKQNLFTDQPWVDECNFPLYKMPSITKYDDGYHAHSNDYEIRLHITCEIVSVKSLGTISKAEHLLKAAKMHLTRKFGFFKDYMKKPISILPDSPTSRKLNSLQYKVNHNKFGEDDIGYYLPLDKDHVLNLHFSFFERNYESLKGYKNFSLGLVEKVMQSVVVNSAIQFSHSIIEKEETLDWDDFSIPDRYDLERNLLNQGKVKPEDCHYTFDEASLKSDSILINTRRKNFLKTPALVSSLDFENFSEKIQIPNSQHPDNPVEQEISRLIDEKSKRLDNFLSGLHIGN